jgi:glycosyltransferase involved in cell wall biosynthesis
MKIHVWVPDYASAIGGIQTFSRFLVRGLRGVFPEAKISILSKNDTSYPDPESDPADKFIPLGWWHRRLRTVAFADELFRAAVRDRPDFVITAHVNFAPVARMVKKFLRIPYAAVGHGVEVWEIRNESVRRALRSASVLLAVSHFTRARMAAELRVDANTIAILPNTFDPAQFYPEPKPHFLLKRYGLERPQPTILTIARLASAERYKGYDQILRALPIVRSQYPNVHYVLGGRGPDKPRVEKLIRELEVGKNVTLAGYIPDYELRNHYNLCDVFAMPSKGEGFGIVFLEALACAKPVLAGNKDGSVDAVLNGELGALVDPDHIGQIADELQKIIHHSHQSGADAANEKIRARVIEAYAYEHFQRTLADVLQPIVRSTSAKKVTCAA